MKMKIAVPITAEKYIDSHFANVNLMEFIQYQRKMK